MRDVYHHITAVEAFTKVLRVAEAGGRPAILDFRPRPIENVPGRS